MIIQIITEKVDMPKSVSERRYVLKWANDKRDNQRLIIDTENNKTVFEGSREKAVLICHNLNKKNYKIK